MPIKNTRSQLNSELTFLIACCQTNLNKADTEFIHSYINTPCLAMDTLIGLARQHGILPLVYKTLLALNTDISVVNAFKQQYLSIAQRNIFMSAELIRIMKLLEDNGINSLAFKGPALSQMAYGDITLRQYGDLDILIKQDDIHKISTLLGSKGYEQAHIFTAVQEKNWYKHAKDMILFHSEKGIYIELHWLLLDNDYPMQVDLNAIWAHPKTIVINRQKIQTFSTESLLLYLCIHGSKHLWERIEWIKDIDLMIRNTQNIDWEYLDRQVNESGFKRMFLLGLYLSTTLFHTPLPTIFKQQIHEQKWLMKLNDFVMSDWQHHRNMFYNSAAMIHLFPSIKMKLLYLHKVIIKPSKSEYSFVDLPKGLYWVYYFVRPYLLLKKYLTNSR